MRTFTRVLAIVSLVVLSVAGSPSIQGAEQQGARQSGVVVESVAKGSAGDRAGVQPGDVLLSWVRKPAPPANPAQARGEIRNPFDWMDVELEQGPRAEVWVFGTRDGSESSVTLAPAIWGIAVRPRMSEALISNYQQGKKAVEAREFEKAIALWGEAAGRMQREGKAELACWLFMKLGDALAEARRWAAAHGAYRDALEAARQGPKEIQDSASARIWRAEGSAYSKENEPGKAEEAYREALGISTRLSPESLASAATLNRLGTVALDRGDLATAEECHRRSLAIREKLAPGSLDLAESLNILGKVAGPRRPGRGGGSVPPIPCDHGGGAGEPGWRTRLNNLGIIAEDRGDLAAAEDLPPRSGGQGDAGPGSLDVAASLNNLGNIAQSRATWPRRRIYTAARLAITEKLAPGSLDVAAGSTTSASSPGPWRPGRGGGSVPAVTLRSRRSWRRVACTWRRA